MPTKTEMKRAKKKSPVLFFIPSEDKQKLSNAAHDERMSLSEFVRRAALAAAAKSSKKLDMK